MSEMIAFLIKLKGNAKPCILTEPLWGIPVNLYTPFIVLFMYGLGVGDIEIGIILSVGLASQVVFAFIGGVVTDKYGRRRTTFIAEFFAWSIPALLWALSQNFWWFIAAAIFNGARNITLVSFECLWVDEINDQSKINTVFNWMLICGLLSVFFAPIAGYFVQVHGVVPVMRVLYVFAFFSMSAKFTSLYILCKETDRGRERMEATKNTSLFRLLWGYKDVFVQISRSRDMIRALVLLTLEGISLVIILGFFALFVTQNLGLPEAFLAYFPILRAGLMLLFMLGIQSRLNRFKPVKVMLAGLLLYVVAFGWLLAAPVDNWLWIAGFVAMDACASALFMPRMRGMAAHYIEPKERARIRSLFHVIVLAISTPFGYLAGRLSDLDRQLPFVLVLAIFVIMVIFTAVNIRKEPPSYA